MAESTEPHPGSAIPHQFVAVAGGPEQVCTRCGKSPEQRDEPCVKGQAGWQGVEPRPTYGDHFGGHFICESVSGPDFDLITAAPQLLADVARLRAALEKITEHWRRSSQAWRPSRVYPTPYSEAWHQGFHTALAEASLIASAALDPEGSKLWDELKAIASSASDRAWFERTGNCGHCGQHGGDHLHPGRSVRLRSPRAPHLAHQVLRL